MASRTAGGNLEQLLGRDHTLYGAILYGLDGHTIELEARATNLLRNPTSWKNATTVIGIARGARRGARSHFRRVRKIAGAGPAGRDHGEPRSVR